MPPSRLSARLRARGAAEGLDHVQFLARLVELELIDRERRMIERRIKAAKFPATKSLDSFDFKAIPKLNKMQVLELARCEWTLRRENVIMPEACLRHDALGPSGTGKTHIMPEACLRHDALGLGLAACQKGMSVSFTTAAAAAFANVARTVYGWLLHGKGVVRLWRLVGCGHVVRGKCHWFECSPERVLVAALSPRALLAVRVDLVPINGARS